MSIQRANKIIRLSAYVGLSVVIGFLAFILNKKQQENYSVLLDKGSDVVHADVSAIPSSFGTGDGGGGSADGNDSGSGGSAY